MMNDFCLEMHKTRGEKTLHLKLKITSVRLARRDIKIRITTQSIGRPLFFLCSVFFFFVGKNDTKSDVLVFLFFFFLNTLEENVINPSALAHLNRSRKVSSVFKFHAPNKQNFTP